MPSPGWRRRRRRPRCGAPSTCIAWAIGLTMSATWSCSRRTPISVLRLVSWFARPRCSARVCSNPNGLPRCGCSRSETAAGTPRSRYAPSWNGRCAHPSSALRAVDHRRVRTDTAGSPDIRPTRQRSLPSSFQRLRRAPRASYFTSARVCVSFSIIVTAPLYIDSSPLGFRTPPLLPSLPASVFSTSVPPSVPR